jgi:SAM-dependent methyltransferase
MKSSRARSQQALIHPCPCGGRRYRSYPLLRFDSCQVARCVACGLLRTSPEPSAEDLERVYDARTSQKYTIDRGPEHKRLWTEFARQLVDVVERHQPRRGRLLDVGCDTGEVLAEARDRGWDVTGVELNKPVAEQVSQRLGVPIFASTLESAGLPDAGFDVVFFNQVLEHLPDPNRFLAEVRRVLASEGVIFVGVPCFTSPIPLLLKRDDWYALVPNEHIWQFGPWTLPRLLESNGFEIVELKRGCSGFWGRFSLHPRDAARWLVYRSVDLLRQGDFLNVVAQKRR